MRELIDNLSKRNMNGYFAADTRKALETAIGLIPEGSSVGFGGSVTLEQIGILDTLRERDDIELIDRTKCRIRRNCTNCTSGCSPAIYSSRAQTPSLRTDR